MLRTVFRVALTVGVALQLAGIAAAAREPSEPRETGAGLGLVMALGTAAACVAAWALLRFGARSPNRGRRILDRYLVGAIGIVALAIALDVAWLAYRDG